MGEQLKLSLGLDLVHVPYNGAGPAIAAVVAGHVPMSISSTPPASAHIGEGRLRAIAVTGETRSQSLPDVPTMAEAGYPETKGRAMGRGSRAGRNAEGHRCRTESRNRQSAGKSGHQGALPGPRVHTGRQQPGRVRIADQERYGPMGQGHPGGQSETGLTYRTASAQLPRLSGRGKTHMHGPRPFGG